MAKLAITFGVLLIALGVGTFLPRRAVTALIPAFFGVPLVLAGLVALRPALRMHAMHAAALVGVLGLLGSAVMFVRGVAGGALETRPVAVYSQGAMAVLMLAFVVLCVRSFVAARRSREAGAPGLDVAR